MVEFTTLQMKEKAKQELFDDPDIMGIGIGKGSTEMINVYVRSKMPEILAKIPKVLNGIPTRIIESGTIMALPFMGSQLPQSLDVSRTEKHRPAFGGISIGHSMITAGTFSTLVRDNISGRNVILSNCHVFHPDPRQNTIPSGDVLQPGSADGGTIDDKLAEVLRWIPLDDSINVANNIVDCALTMPLSNDYVINDILDIGPVNGTGMVQVNETVKKSGRTTGLTTAQVVDVDADVKVGYITSYGEEFSVSFTDQIVTSYMAAGGDSGSLLVNESNQAVGLLFAGSDNLTVHNKIQNVMTELNISFDGEGSVPPIQAGMWMIAIPLMLGFLYTMFKK